MKRYPKLIQADKRGQIVIPKDVRTELQIDETTGFFVYVVPNEGIMLKQVEPPKLDEDALINEIKKNAKKLGLDEKKIQEMINEYKNNKGGLQDV